MLWQQQDYIPSYIHYLPLERHILYAGTALLMSRVGWGETFLLIKQWNIVSKTQKI